MSPLSIDDERALQDELVAGEGVIWSGKPNPKIIFHSEDLFLIPFSLMWGGFSIFWEWGTSKNSFSFMTLWGIPFVIVGQYFIWGRFVYAAWKKRKILYALTTKRALVVVRPPKGTTISCFLGAISTIQKQVRSDGYGTITFGQPISLSSQQQQSFDSLKLNKGIPVFVDIPDASEVFAIAEKTQTSLST